MRRFFISKKIKSNSNNKCFLCNKVFDFPLQQMITVNGVEQYICDQCYEKDVVICLQCNKQILSNVAYQYNGQYLCRDCYQQYYSKCDNCSRLFLKEDLTQVDGYDYCQQCLWEEYTMCDECGEYVHYTDSVLTYDEQRHQINVCESCADKFQEHCYFCNDSIDIYSKNYCAYYYQDKACCESCFQDRCGICAGCDQVFLYDQLTLGRDENYYCQDCYQQVGVQPQEQDNNKIFSYGTKINSDFKSLDQQQDTNQYLGIQLQIKNSNQSTQQIDQFVLNVSSKNKNLIFKQDASLGPFGVELVTKPCTYNFHKHQFGWQRIFHYMKKNNMTQTDNCGLHIHISRDNFTKDQLKCLDYFVNNCSKYLSQIGGRDFTNDSKSGGYYCKQNKKKDSEYGEALSDRYESVNFKNQNTVQLRFFKSTAQFSQFRKRLGLAHNMCKLAKFFSFEDLKTLDETDLKYCFHQVIKNIY